jgi:hypothetical protein
MDESTTGTADEAAAARDSGTALRSEQITSKMRWVKTKREPVEMSVADAKISVPTLVGNSFYAVEVRCTTGAKPSAIDSAFPHNAATALTGQRSPGSRHFCAYP